jgi:hypothetical protein
MRLKRKRESRRERREPAGAPSFAEIDLAGLRVYLAPPQLVVACAAARPGTSIFLTHLEWAYFPPDNPERNALYKLAQLRWQNMVWFVLGVPPEYRPAVEQVAGVYRLRLANGVPHKLGLDGRGDVVAQAVFPLSGDHVWILEGAEGNRMYDWSEWLGSGAEQARREELRLLAEFERTRRQRGAG